MGHKVHPYGFRIGIIKPWLAKWYADRDYATLLQEDMRIRELVAKQLSNASVSQVEIERGINHVTVTVHTAKPGIVIGKGGANVEALRTNVGKLTNKKVKLEIKEILQPELDGMLLAQNVAGQLERRIAFRKAIKQSIQRTIKAGAKGVKIQVSGRLGGSEMSRTEWDKEGRIPLGTLRADISYGVVHAHTTYGRIGVKAWVYRGEQLGERPGSARTEPRAPRRGAAGTRTRAAGTRATGSPARASAATAVVEEEPQPSVEAEAPKRAARAPAAPAVETPVVDTPVVEAPVVADGSGRRGAGRRRDGRAGGRGRRDGARGQGGREGAEARQGRRQDQGQGRCRDQGRCRAKACRGADARPTSRRRRSPEMLMPKRVKHRKVQRGRRAGLAKGGTTVSFGDFGLMAEEVCWLTSRQIEAARRAMTHHIKRGGRVWIRVFPDKPVTKKPAEVRMGSGKGAPDHWVAVVKPGRVMFEMSGVPEPIAREAMRLAGHKLPINTKFVVKEGQEHGHQ